MYELGVKTIAQIKTIIKETPYEEYPSLIKELYGDKRDGVHKLAVHTNLRYSDYLNELDRIDNLRMTERSLKKDGYSIVAGADEAGRGPLCGPVVSAFVVMPDDSDILYVNDSKKLSEKKREELYEKITAQAVSFGVGIVDSDTIDRINILNATKLSMEKALSELSMKPDMLILDAITINTDIPQKSFIKGDANHYLIAAASIVAKVTRDRIMQEYALQYPQYDFAKNKGYGTYEHIQAIRVHGMCPIHRRTFISREMLAKVPSSLLGVRYENVAAEYLTKQGFKIIGRNYKREGGEIDIIFEDNGATVFCEVKARSSNYFGTPEEQVTFAKQKRIKMTANRFLTEKAVFNDSRFDIIAIDVHKDGKYEIRHHKNAFQ